LKDSKKVLIHTCCAICSGYPLTYLKDAGYEPVAYFFNPNIQPKTEYLKRLEAEKKLCQNLECELIAENYEPQEFEKIISGLESEPEGGKRCEKCFELRLSQSAKMAVKLGIASITTSIVISPHKSFKLISEIGKTICEKYGINYLDIDFKKKDGFLKSNKIARELELYRQNYCGCLYGKRESET